MEMKRKKSVPLSIVIIGKNDEEKIADCIESCKSLIDKSGEIIYLDTGSTDHTLEIAQRMLTQTHVYTKGFFADWRNKGKALARGKWLLYIDTDERISSQLELEIRTIVASGTSHFAAYALPRKNMIFGKHFLHGGESPDYQIRLFKRTELDKWHGDVHEHPLFKGELGYLKGSIIHLKHDLVSQMIEKTDRWSQIEANLMYNAHHPTMNIIRFTTAMGREWYDRFLKKKGQKDGKEGVVYSWYQVFSRFVSYAKLWEMQKKHV